MEPNHVEGVEGRGLLGTASDCQLQTDLMINGMDL